MRSSDSRPEGATGSGRDPALRTPGWVKVQGIILLLLILLVVAMPAGLLPLGHEGHSPDGHAAGGHTRPEGGHEWP